MIPILQDHDIFIRQVINLIAGEDRESKQYNAQIQQWSFFNAIHYVSGKNNLHIIANLSHYCTSTLQKNRTSSSQMNDVLQFVTFLFSIRRNHTIVHFGIQPNTTLTPFNDILRRFMYISTGWGQIESLYTSFLLLCAYFLLKEKPFWAMMMFGFAISFKSQSIFFLPFLGILFLKGKIRWFHFLLVPLVYVVLAIPAALIGRSWVSILSIYIGQVEQYHSLSMSAPNLYIFIPDVYYEPGVWVGMCIFVIAMAIWGWFSWWAKIAFNNRQIMLMALASLVLVPFVLPKMHDRYFYPADAFSFAAAIFVPEMWFVPILYQIISSLSYTVFILNTPPTYVMIAALINTGVVGYILWKQFQSFRE